jgi:hypothetical protein
LLNDGPVIGGGLSRFESGAVVSGGRYLDLPPLIHGNSAASTRTAFLYGLYRNDGTFLKWGITQNLAKRYPKSFMRDHYLERVTSGNRADMLRMERALVETRPGPWNREPWNPLLKAKRAGGGQ